jgi:hypothetical protein
MQTASWRRLASQAKLTTQPVHVERGARHEFQVYLTITGTRSDPILERFSVIKDKIIEINDKL